MSGDLLVLASKYVALTGEIDDVRRQMLACLTNGAGANPVRPTPAKRPGAKGPQPSNPKAIEAAKAEEAIVDLLRTASRACVGGPREKLVAALRRAVQPWAEGDDRWP